MKGKLMFQIEKDFDSVTYPKLINLGTYFYDKNIKKYIWIFPLSNLKQVQEAIGVGLEFNEDLKPLIELNPAMKENINVPNFKGKGEISIVEYPKIFKVCEKRKVENSDGTFEIKDIKHDVNKEIIKTIWDNVLMKFPKDKPIKSETVIRNIFELLQIKVDSNKPRILRDTKNYILFFWAPLKVLSKNNCVIHHKRGKVERISDNLFEFQTQFKENIISSEEVC